MSFDSLNDWVEAGAPSDQPVTVIQPAANPEQAALLEWAAAHPIDRPTVGKNGHGRYHSKVPGATKAKGYTRATTFASALDDAGGLNVWRHRLLAEGLVSTDDLVAAVRNACSLDDTAARNAALSKHVGTALHLAGEKLSADVGSAIHLACDHHDLGTGHAPPAPYDACVTAWTSLLDAYSLRVDESGIERVLWSPEVECIGTADRLVAGPWGPKLRIVDVKTGSSVQHLSYAVQVPIYANATHWWTGTEWAEVPDIDTEVGYIAHLPATDPGTWTLYEVDLRAGWELAKLTAKVRQARSAPAVRSLFGVAAVPEIVDGADAAAAVDQADEVAAFPASSAVFAPGSPELVDLRTTWIRQRMAILKGIEAAKADLVLAWKPTGIPLRPPWSDEQIDAIANLLDRCEARHDVPFGPSDPGLAAKREAERAARAAAVPPPLPERPAPDEGELVDDAMVAELRQRTAKLASHQRDEGASWVAQARRAGKPLGQVIDGHWSERSYAINTAIYACASALVDEDPEITRQTMTAALSFVIGEDVHPVWPIGELFASLTTDEAVRLAEFAAAFAEGDTEIGAVITAALTKAA